MPRRSILSAAERASLLTLSDLEDELIRHYTFSEVDLTLIRQRQCKPVRLRRSVVPAALSRSWPSARCAILILFLFYSLVRPFMPRIVKKPNDRLKFLLSAESNSSEFANQLSQYPQPLISLRLVSVTEI